MFLSLLQSITDIFRQNKFPPACTPRRLIHATSLSSKYMVVAALGCCYRFTKKSPVRQIMNIHLDKVTHASKYSKQDKNHTRN